MWGWFKVKSPKSFLAKVFVVQNQSYVARNYALQHFNILPHIHCACFFPSRVKERDVFLTYRACFVSSWPEEPDMQHIYRACFQKNESSSTSIELIYLSSRLYERDILQIYTCIMLASKISGDITQVRATWLVMRVAGYYLHKIKIHVHCFFTCPGLNFAISISFSTGLISWGPYYIAKKN